MDASWIMAGTAALALFGGVLVWLVRLEGRTTANTVAIVASGATAKAAMDATDKRLDSHIAAQDKAREEIIRLQEQIKHLTDLIERWLSPAPKRGTRRQPTDEA